MITATLSELKTELHTIPPSQVLELCLHLAKYKKENKELLSYLLFDASDEQGFIKSVKDEIDEQLLNLNRSSLFLAKKTLRKILRTTNKYIRYSGLKRTEVDLLIYYCKKLKNSGIAIQKSIVLNNMYMRQIQKINKALKTLHEDLQFDYQEELKSLN
jgi:hypothetical protein